MISSSDRKNQVKSLELMDSNPEQVSIHVVVSRIEYLKISIQTRALCSKT